MCGAAAARAWARLIAVAFGACAVAVCVLALAAAVPPSARPVLSMAAEPATSSVRMIRIDPPITCREPVRFCAIIET